MYQACLYTEDLQITDHEGIIIKDVLSRINIQELKDMTYQHLQALQDKKVDKINPAQQI